MYCFILKVSYANKYKNVRKEGTKECKTLELNRCCKDSTKRC